ncbi:UNVERIFIED_CONTAM: hypothetical protein K2H54_032803 [Gekko kuhli]
MGVGSVTNYGVMDHPGAKLDHSGGGNELVIGWRGRWQWQQQARQQQEHPALKTAWQQCDDAQKRLAKEESAKMRQDQEELLQTRRERPAPAP